jgi:hypothetical protein
VIQTMSWHLHRAGAVDVASRLQATVSRVPGANPHRRYVVRRGPLHVGWRVVKLT